MGGCFGSDILNPQGGGGGGGAVDSVNGFTGVVTLDTDDIPEGATNLYFQDSYITKTPNTFGGFDGTGLLQSVPGWNINTLDGVQAGQTYTPAGGAGGTTLHSLALNIEPTAASPDRQINLFQLDANIDPTSSGFDFGSNGNAVRMININASHVGTGDSGEVNLINNYFNLGNGTDPITVNGISYIYGFGNINAGVTISGSIQGYGFQPAVNASAVISNNVTGFYENANFACAVGSYNSFQAGPILASINNNNNYNAFNINPTITTFTGNAGMNGIAISGNLGTINTGSFNGVSVNPNITLNNNYVSGINVNLDNVTNFAGVQSTLVVQDITYTFIAPGDNNSYQIEYLDDVVAGNESFDISGFLITVHMESGVSTATQIAAAAAANFGFTGAVNTVITGVASNPQTAFAATNFINGVNPGRTQAGYFKGDVEIDGALTFSGALSVGALNAFATYSMVSGSGNPASTHSLVTGPTVAASATVTLADYLGVNTAMLLNIGDNATVTTGFLGVQALGLPAVVTMGTGSTVDHVGGAVFALSLDSAATGGTIDIMDLCSALAIPNAATTVNELRGYFFDMPFGDVGTDIWGVYSKPAAAHNYFAGDVIVGGTDLPTNASVGIELNSTTKAVLVSRMDSTQEGALTATNGMIIYNTTTNKFRGYENGAWVDLI